jgi:hypothetical protein
MQVFSGVNVCYFRAVNFQNSASKATATKITGVDYEESSKIFVGLTGYARAADGWLHPVRGRRTLGHAGGQ